jgi:hypothetical protein
MGMVRAGYTKDRRCDFEERVAIGIHDVGLDERLRGSRLLIAPFPNGYSDIRHSQAGRKRARIPGAVPTGLTQDRQYFFYRKTGELLTILRSLAVASQSKIG